MKIIIGKKSSGSIMLLVCMFSLIFAALGVISMRIIVSQSSSDEIEIIKSRLFYAADSSIERSMSEVVRLTNIQNGGNFYELPLATAAPVAASPWRVIYSSTPFRYHMLGTPQGALYTRYVYYIETHTSNPNLGTIDANKWMVFDNETLPPIKTRSVMREETYPMDAFNFPIPWGYTDPWAWIATDGDANSTPTNNHSLSVIQTNLGVNITVVRRYYVITSQASLYNPTTGAIYGDVYTSEAHILIERKGNTASTYKYNYVFRSRKNL
jgi:hypothetical protein